MSGTRTLCCHVALAARTFAIYYLICTVLVIMDMVVGVTQGKDICGFVHTEHMTHRQQMFDTGSNLLMLFLMMMSCSMSLLAPCRGSVCLVPFMLLLMLDVSLSVFSLFGGPWGPPGTPTYKDSLRLAEYLNGSQFVGVDPTHASMVFGVLFVLYLLIKVYMLQVVMRYYFVLKEPETPQNSCSGRSVTVKLPSYDEALKLKPKDMPPVYQEP